MPRAQQTDPPSDPSPARPGDDASDVPTEAVVQEPTDAAASVPDPSAVSSDPDGDAPPLGEDTIEQAERPAPPTVVDILRLQLQQKEDRLHSYIAAYKQAKGEMAKVQERMKRDRAKEVGRAKMSAARDLLEVLDNLDRTVEGVDEDGPAGSLAQGILMVRNQFVAVLQGFGVERMEALGTSFDPKLHEAVGMIPAPKGKADQEILFVQRAGYLFDGMLLRAAQVIIAAAP